MKGYWIHHDKQLASGAKKGQRTIINRYLTGCGWANPYIGRTERPKRIDTRCMGCGKRVTFNPELRYFRHGRDERGSIRQAVFYRKDDWTNSAIAKHCRETNALNVGQTKREPSGFTTASKIVETKSKSKPPPQNKTNN